MSKQTDDQVILDRTDLVWLVSVVDRRHGLDDAETATWARISAVLYGDE